MTPEIEELWRAAMDLPEDQRAAYIESRTGDPGVRREVLSLLVHDAQAEQFFGNALGSAASSFLSSQEFAPGTRIGAYAVQQILGRGGMGAVYLARRADGAFEQQVAIKVIQSADPSGSLREHFERERQILAGLNHPNIARLLDGGQTAEGRPFFVLEYVSGHEVDRYCAKRNLGLRDRLRLFLPVCAAVQYAHENLVVHRDLKPGNILVDQNGVPKLLDFGIAKVLDPDQSGAGSAPTRILTPEYASPEQMRGEPLTTAADIYSSGAVLFCLLTGRTPHVVENLSPLEAARTISQEPAPPATGVPADVAAILAKALHADPARRYRSAYDLGADIQRFLDGQAVEAAPDSVAYRARKFLRRHWVGAAAVAGILVTLLAGGGAAVWEARRAQRNFAQVRHLSNRFLFDFEDAIHDLKGAIKARELVVRTAQEYLSQLAAEAGTDRTLIRELAVAYTKLGDVQGSRVEGNIGDTKGALASYRKALALRDSLGDDRASDLSIQTSYLTALSDLSSLEGSAGDLVHATALCRKAVILADAWLKTGSGNVKFLNAAAYAYARAAQEQMAKKDHAAAVASGKQSLALKQRAFDLNPYDQKQMRLLGTGYWAAAATEKAAGKAELAVADFTTAQNLLQQLADQDLTQVGVRRELLAVSWQLASSTKDLLRQQKRDFSPALPLFDRAFQSGTQLLRDDPANDLVQSDLAGISLAFGSTLLQCGQPAQALAVLQPAIERQHKRLLASPGDRATAYNLALLYEWSASSHVEQRHLPAALADRRTARELLDRVVAASPGTNRYVMDQAENLHETGNILAALHDSSGARECYRRGIDMAEKLPPGAAAAQLLKELRASSQSIAAPR